MIESLMAQGFHFFLAKHHDPRSFAESSAIDFIVIEMISMSSQQQSLLVVPSSFFIMGNLKFVD